MTGWSRGFRAVLLAPWCFICSSWQSRVCWPPRPSYAKTMEGILTSRIYFEAWLVIRIIDTSMSPMSSFVLDINLTFWPLWPRGVKPVARFYLVSWGLSSCPTNNSGQMCGALGSRHQAESKPLPPEAGAIPPSLLRRFVATWWALFADCFGHFWTSRPWFAFYLVHHSTSTITYLGREISHVDGGGWICNKTCNTAHIGMVQASVFCVFWVSGIGSLSLT